MQGARLQIGSWDKNNNSITSGTYYCKDLDAVHVCLEHVSVYIWITYIPAYQDRFLKFHPEADMIFYSSPAINFRHKFIYSKLFYKILKGQNRKFHPVLCVYISALYSYNVMSRRFSIHDCTEAWRPYPFDNYISYTLSTDWKLNYMSCVRTVSFSWLAS